MGMSWYGISVPSTQRVTYTSEWFIIRVCCRVKNADGVIYLVQERKNMNHKKHTTRSLLLLVGAILCDFRLKLILFLFSYFVYHRSRSKTSISNKNCSATPNHQSAMQGNERELCCLGNAFQGIESRTACDTGCEYNSGEPFWTRASRHQ